MEQRDRSAEVVLAQEVRRVLAARAALARAAGEHPPGPTRDGRTAAVRSLDPRHLGRSPSGTGGEPR